MRRREFINLVGGVAATLPFAARAQQAAMPVIGVLSNGAAADKRDYMAAFYSALKEAGFVEGQNVAIAYRYAGNEVQALPALASELVRQRVAVIFAGSTDAGLAAGAATATIPIVFAGGADPEKFGFTGNLNRPVGNLTGVSFLNEATVAKRLEVLHEVVPNARVIGHLVNPTVAQADKDIRDGLDAARILGLDLRLLNASNESEIDAAFATLRQ